MRKVILLVTFFVMSPVIFLFALIYLLQISSRVNNQTYFANNKQINAFSYAALPSNINTISDDITEKQGKTEIIHQFLAKYNSPLEPYADFIVQMADKYGLDFRLVPAIAMQESNLCKKIPTNSHNCWGFGIYGGKITRFDDYQEGIETVTKTLALKYKQKGLVTPEEIMSMYTPSSNGSWAHGVNHFMKELE